MARKKTNPEEEANVTAAVEEPAGQDAPLTEGVMPPDDVAVANEGNDPSPPLSIEMPTAEEAGADEIPVPAEMQDTGKEPEPAEKYGVDTLEEAAPPDHVPSAEESDWGFQEEQKSAEPEAETPAPPKPSKSDRQKFYELKFHDLDRNLTPEERQEWNTIYASYRGRSAITGTIIGVDPLSIYVWNPQTEQREKKTMYCAIVVPYRVRIVIPALEMWEEGEERPDYVLQNMIGATVDLIIIKVEREGNFAIGSRRLANRSQRYFFAHREDLHRIGARVKCRMLAVGPRRCLVACSGHDLDMTQREMR